MNALTEPQFANFIWNQRQRVGILREDNNIQLAGLQDEERNWVVARDFFSQKGDRARVEVIERELDSVRNSQSERKADDIRLQQLGSMIDELVSLPEVSPHIKRIADAQEAIARDWRLLK